jgi:hypothetical protein
MKLIIKNRFFAVVASRTISRAREIQNLRARDLNGNGKINDIGEFFGDATTPDFTALDSNNDNKISAAASFFAQSYTWAGKTVISYRGTDNLLGNLSSLFTNGDIWNGYGVGAGSPQGKQAELALNFYKSVAGAGVDPRIANISVTGHSLGGGLARVNPSVPDQVRA